MNRENEYPHIWPIGKAFAGFVAAFIGKPEEYPYSYHGLKEECKKEPEPDPYLLKMVEEYGARWEPLFERTNKKDQIYTVNYNVEDFKPSGSLDTCTEKFPDHFKRYYFCKIEIWDGEGPIGWSRDDNGLIPCRVWSTAGQWKYYYKSYEATLWAGKPWLVWIFQWIPNSHFAVWRSTNGDYPPVPPIPIQEYYIE